MRIDQIKSAISSRGGPALSNRYAVFITHPSASFNESQLRSGNLLSDTTNRPARFIAEPRDLFILCDAVQLPGRQIETVDHKTSIKQYKKPNGYLTEDVDMTFTLTNDYYVWNFFNQWLDTIVVRDVRGGQAHKVRFKHEYVTDIIIQQIGRNNRETAKSVRLINSYPITMDAVDLANSNQSTVAQCNVAIAYDDWVEEDSYSTISDLARTTTPSNNVIPFVRRQVQNFVTENLPNLQGINFNRLFS